jgi:hypothetical protein
VEKDVIIRKYNVLSTCCISTCVEGLDCATKFSLLNQSDVGLSLAPVNRAIGAAPVHEDYLIGERGGHGAADAVDELAQHG